MLVRSPFKLDHRDTGSLKHNSCFAIWITALLRAGLRFRSCSEQQAADEAMKMRCFHSLSSATDLGPLNGGILQSLSLNSFVSSSVNLLVCNSDVEVRELCYFGSSLLVFCFGFPQTKNYTVGEKLQRIVCSPFALIILYVQA